MIKNLLRRRAAMTLATSAFLVSACGASKVSAVPVAGRATHPVRTIAMAPSGGLLADAVAVELSNRGYTVIDAADTSRMMIRMNLDEIDMSRPEGLAKFSGRGIDAILSVRSAGGYDEQPQSASARVTSTDTGRVIAGVTWQNGWGGMAGSIADRTMRQGLADAAKQIADALVQNLPTN